MRYSILLLWGAVTTGILGLDSPAPSGNVVDTYNLQRTEIRGVVEYVQDQEAYILTDDGDEIAVQLGEQSYWDRHDYHLRQGEYVRMYAWYDPYDHTEWYFAGEIWGPGFHYVLINGYGVPYWVLARSDYYYGLGYRASCISYMIWYDCPPVYFVYLILPPPPPPTYVCYYGRHWREHHRDWHHGSRYGRDGSYWRDGRGYDPPTPRGGHRDHPNGPFAEEQPVPGAPGYGGQDKVTVPDRPVPSSPNKAKAVTQPKPVVKTQPIKTPVKSEQKYESKAPQNEQKFQQRVTAPQTRTQTYKTPAVAPSNPQKVQTSKPAPQPESRYQAPTVKTAPPAQKPQPR
jgi:hypothetical protein